MKEQTNRTLAACVAGGLYWSFKLITDPIAARQIEALQKNCKEFGVPLFDMDSPDQGIVHVIGPELGFTQPGMTIVCGDSHTSTHGALGSLD